MEHREVVPDNAQISERGALILVLVFTGGLIGIHGTWLTIALVTLVEMLLMAIRVMIYEIGDKTPTKRMLLIGDAGVVACVAMWMVVLIRSVVVLTLNGLSSDIWHHFIR